MSIKVAVENKNPTEKQQAAITKIANAGMPIKENQAGVYICMPDYIDLTACTSNNEVVDLDTGIEFDAFCDRA